MLKKSQIKMKSMFSTFKRTTKKLNNTDFYGSKLKNYWTKTFYFEFSKITNNEYQLKILETHIFIAYIQNEFHRF